MDVAWSVLSTFHRILAPVACFLGWTAALCLVAGLTYLLLRWTVWSARLPATYPDGRVKHVLVTGCDSGFGAGLARKLHAEGYHVYAGCLFSESVTKLNAEFGGKRMTARRMNITKDADVAGMCATIRRDGGDLWAVVNNAGIFHGAHIEWTPLRDFERVMSVNYLGGVRVTKAVLPFLRVSRGRVVNVTSAAGFSATASLSAYCASKHAFEAFTESLRLEMNEWGVKVTAIEPGFFATPMVKNSSEAMDAMYRRLPDETRALWGDAWWTARQKRVELISCLAGEPSIVVEKLFKAVSAEYPSPRYQVGWDSQFLYNLMFHMPTRVRDFLQYKIVMGTKPRPAGVTAATGAATIAGPKPMMGDSESAAGDDEDEDDVDAGQDDAAADVPAPATTPVPAKKDD